MTSRDCSKWIISKCEGVYDPSTVYKLTRERAKQLVDGLDVLDVGYLVNHLESWGTFEDDGLFFMYYPPVKDIDCFGNTTNAQLWILDRDDIVDNVEDENNTWVDGFNVDGTITPSKWYKGEAEELFIWE